MRFEIRLKLAGLPYMTPGSQGQGLPEKLEPRHAIPETCLLPGKIEVHLQHGTADPEWPSPLFPPYVLAALCSAKAPEDALEHCREPLQNVVQWLRIDTLGPVTPFGTVHVAPAGGRPGPVAIRPDALGYVFPEYSFQSLAQIQGGFSPDRMATKLDERIGRAVGWFAKSVGERSVVDAFISTWVCVEILSAVDPDGRGAINRRVRQLLQRTGASDDEAEQLWKLRQIVHGARGLGKLEVSELVDPLQALRRYALAVIKAATGIPAEDPPHIFTTGPVISDMALIGTTGQPGT